MRFLPAAEDMIFNTALRTARSEQRLARMGELAWPAFVRYPWFGEFWDAVFLLSTDRNGGRAALARLAAVHPENAAEIVTKVAGDQAGHLGALLAAADVDRATLRPR